MDHSQRQVKSQEQQSLYTRACRGVGAVDLHQKKNWVSGGTWYKISGWWRCDVPGSRVTWLPLSSELGTNKSQDQILALAFR